MSKQTKPNAAVHPVDDPWASVSLDPNPSETTSVAGSWKGSWTYMSYGSGVGWSAAPTLVPHVPAPTIAPPLAVVPAAARAKRRVRLERTQVRPPPAIGKRRVARLPAALLGDGGKP